MALMRWVGAKPAALDTSDSNVQEWIWSRPFMFLASLASSQTLLPASITSLEAFGLACLTSSAFWLEEAQKHVNTPVVFVSIALNSGTRYYSLGYVGAKTQTYKGNILTLPQIQNSVGDIKRTYERSKIRIVFNDSDYEFRGLEASESVSFKNRTVTIQVAFADDDFTNPLTIFTGYIYDWRRGDDLTFEFDIEEKSHNMENEYPDKRVELTDYANADGSAIGWAIPVPYGTISANGTSNDGAFGHPSLSTEGSGTGMLFIDTTVNSEKHLVGLQGAAITVDRVYKNGVLQTEGAGNDYQITTATVNGQTHTVIAWETGNNPITTSFISCDITFGTRRPVEAIKHFLKTFCGYADADFNTTSYTNATTTETSRGYTFDGALWEKRPLRTLLDEWRDEFELDIYWNKSGEVCFQYISGAVTSGTNKYTGLLHVLDTEFSSDPRVYQIINYLKYGYNFHYSKTYFYNYGTYEKTDSQTKYGATYKDFSGFYWTRSSATALDIASRKLLRFKDPITFDTMGLPLNTFSDNLADFIKITYFGGGGSSGYSEKLFQVRKTNYDLDSYINSVILEDATNFAGKTCRLGDDTSLPAKWTDGTSAQQEYCYLCDLTTSQFSDGADGKQLFD